MATEGDLVLLLVNNFEKELCVMTVEDEREEQITGWVTERLQ